MRIKVTQVQIFDFPDSNWAHLPDVEKKDIIADVLDAFQDAMLNAQDVEHEIENGAETYVYVPGEIVLVAAWDVADDENETRENEPKRKEDV